MWIVEILVLLLKNAWPPPDFENEQDTEAWLVKLSPTLAKIIAKVAALVPDKDVPGAALDNVDWDSLFTIAVAAVENDPDVCGAAPGRIGDGKILKWLMDHKEEIIQLVTFIITIMPKKAE